MSPKIELRDIEDAEILAEVWNDQTSIAPSCYPANTLLRRSLWEMQEAGFKLSLLGTHRNNHRALLLYTGNGYSIADTTYAYLKDF